MRFHHSIISAAVALACFGAQAADYYVVVPVPNKTVNLSAIGVSLAQTTLPGAVVGTAYSYNFNQNLQVTGDASYSGYGVQWSVASGALPAGLTLNASTGVVSGTPTTSGVSSFVLNVSYKTKTGTQSYQIPVTVAVSVALAKATPPGAILGQAYSYDLKSLLSVTGDNAYNGSGVTWTVVSSTLPTGLYLTADGYIGGTPTVEGTGSVTVRASYKGANGEQTYQVVSLVLTVSLASATLPGVVSGTPYSYDFNTNLSVSEPNYVPSNVTWSVTSGSLPSNLSLNSSTGVVSGTNTSLDNAGSAFTLQATYKNVSATRNYTLYPKDPYLASTSLLMHMADYTDATSKNTLTTSGSPSISSTNKKFGTGGLVLNGSSRLQKPYSANFDFGTGDFTIEFWLNSTVAWTSQPSSAGVLSHKASDATNGWVIYRDGNYPSKLNARIAGALPYCTTASTPTTGVWEHWAVTRQGTSVRWFKNGVLDSTCTITASANVADSTATFYVGYSQTWGGYLNAALDEVRITKGQARYTSNFTVPAAEFPNQ